MKRVETLVVRGQLKNLIIKLKKKGRKKETKRGNILRGEAFLNTRERATFVKCDEVSLNGETRGENFRKLRQTNFTVVLLDFLERVPNK